MAILFMMLTEMDAALKVGREPPSPRNGVVTQATWEKRKHYMQRPSEADLTGKTTGRQPEKC
jgi:hypothetical protein